MAENLQTRMYKSSRMKRDYAVTHRETFQNELVIQNTEKPKEEKNGEEFGY